MVSRFSTQPANIMLGLQMLGQGLQSRSEYEKERVKTAKIEKLKQEAEQMIGKEPEEIARFVAKNPEAKDIFKYAIGAQNEAMLNTSRQYLINQQDPSELHIAEAERDIVEGRDPSGNIEMARAMMSQQGREQATKMHEGVLAMLDPAGYKAYKATQEKPLTPEDKTTAIKEFEYGEKNPKFKLEQHRKLDNKKTKEVSGKSFKDTSDLRKEFLGQSKDYQKVRDAYTRVIGSTNNPSPAGDLSLIFNYMKMLDPGSVVRESEFATAASSGSYGERIQASVQKVLSGQRLTPKMRKDFISKSSTLFSGMEKQHMKREGNYRKIAEKNNLDPEDVVVDIKTPEENQEIKNKPTLQDFIQKASLANPGVSQQELTDYYNNKYGGL